MNTWDRLEDFGRMVYTVGDGVKANTVAELNTLSIANTERAVDVASRDPDAVLFIAGGNSGEHSPRPVHIPGAQMEAQRMALYIRDHLRSNIPVITDCDPEFLERTGLKSSGNTPQNGRNAAKMLQMQPQLGSQVDIVAERIHLFRVIGTFRRKLHDLGLLKETRMRGHPVVVEFDPESDQEHIRSEAAFRAWELKARVHHLLAGEVLRREFLAEWISGMEYGCFFDNI